MTDNSQQPAQQNNRVSLGPQEEILWYRTLQKGIFRKKIVWRG